MSGFNNQGDLSEQLKRTRQSLVGEVVTHLSALASCTHETAAAQTCEMIGDVRSTLTHLVGKLCRICRSIHESNQDLSPHTIGHGRAHTPERVELQIGAHIRGHDPSIVQAQLYYTSRCIDVGAAALSRCEAMDGIRVLLACSSRRPRASVGVARSG